MQSLLIMLGVGFVVMFILFGGCWIFSRIIDKLLDKTFPGGYFGKD